MVYSGSPTLLNCTFTGNATSQAGGGMYNRENSHPTLVNCTFAGNYANSGGGIYNGPGFLSSNGSHPRLINCAFENNFALQRGAGMYNSRSNPTLTDCTFHDNRAVWPTTWDDAEGGRFPIFTYGVHLEHIEDDGSREWSALQKRAQDGPVHVGELPT